MTSDTPWLTAQEERMWRGWLRVNTELSATLQRELVDDAGLSMPDYDVLVNLTDNPEGRVRVVDLARQLFWERSRLSHHVTRMERRGLVERAECPDDGRGAFIAITPAGRTAIQQAAPGHVRAVRRLLLDALDPADVDRLGILFDALLTRMNTTDAPAVDQRRLWDCSLPRTPRRPSP